MDASTATTQVRATGTDTTDPGDAAEAGEPLRHEDPSGTPDLAGARGRRPWVARAAVLTTLALAVCLGAGLWAADARAGTAERLESLSTELDQQVEMTRQSVAHLTTVMDIAESVYELSPDADPEAREALAEALTAARSVTGQQVADERPGSVTQARARLQQATDIRTSLDWASDDLVAALDQVRRSVPHRLVLEAAGSTG
ncbi:hypothetical protein [Antribacter gilvus]|uniref:hypothetical protein n=1 Tax=Antribacter gilvus TaxID=2304675 RepID=UPI000F778C2E|nr:hypothetical protein [Antribacter gilvus]